MNCNTVNTAKIFANLCCEMTPTQQFQQHCTFQFFAPVDRTLFLNLSCNNKTWWSPVSTARYSIIYGKIVTEQTKHTSRHSEKLKITWFPFKKCHVLWRCITNKSSAVHSNYIKSIASAFQRLDEAKSFPGHPCKIAVAVAVCADVGETHAAVTGAKRLLV